MSGPTSARTTCRRIRCTSAAFRRSAARPARAQSCPARIRARAAGGGKRPPTANAACTSTPRAAWYGARRCRHELTGHAMLMDDLAVTDIAAPPPPVRANATPIWRELEAESILHPARGGRRVPQRGAAVLRRQGLGRRAAHGARRRSSRRRSPFTLLHIDTEHNFPEVIDFRDRLRRARPARTLVVRSRRGVDRARAASDCDRAERIAQPAPDRHAAGRHRRVRLRRRASAAPAATRKRRAPRSASSRFRDEFGQWDPKNQRPELWSLYNARVHKGENIRVFPLSNWTELDIWQYIAREKPSTAVDLFRARARRRPPRRHAGAGHAAHARRAGETRRAARRALPHRRRHDLHGAGRVRRSHAGRDHRARRRPRRITERGATRLDDQASEAAMETRKREGYF